MKTIILISCGAKKEKTPQKVEDLYIGGYFKKTLLYAKHLSNKNNAEIFILSAKYGLLELNEIIKPYDLTLNNKGEKYKKNWSYRVIKQLQCKIKKTDKIIFLAGENYIKYLKIYYKNYEEPLQGLSIGKRLKYITEELKNGRIEK